MIREGLREEEQHDILLSFFTSLAQTQVPGSMFPPRSTSWVPLSSKHKPPTQYSCLIYSHSKHTVIVQLLTTMNSKGKRALCHCSAPSLYSPSRRPGSRPHPAPPRLHVRLRSQIDTAFKLRHELLLSARFSTLARARTSPEKARGIKSKAPLLL